MNSKSRVQMLLIFSILVILNIQFTMASGGFPKPTGVYMNQKTLKEPDVYNLHWNISDDKIIFEIHVKHTDGYVAFGLSPTGGMKNSDVIVAWMDDNGFTNFTDRFIYSTRNISIDRKQDWFLLNSFKQDGYFILKFWRLLRICDPDFEDIDIEEGKQNVIFSFGSLDRNTDIVYHGRNRGTKNLHFLGTLNQLVDLDMSEITTFQVTTNTSMTFGAETDYHCESFKIPDEWRTKKQHLVRFEIIPQPGNEQHFHHILMYECNSNFEEEYINKKGIPKPGSCYGIEPSMEASARLWGEALGYCRRISLVWAVGGEYVVDMPQNMGYPIGGTKDSFNWFLLETHYTNTEYKTKQVNDVSSLKLYVTENYRPIELGITSFGAAVSWTSTILPPGVERFPMTYYCKSNCLDGLSSRKEKVNIIGSLAHGHLASREMYTKVIRNGAEYKFITNNKNYDSEYQNYNFLNEPIVLEEGDEVSTTCVYSSKGRPGYTVGGFSTFEEMCLDFVWYYPAGEKFDYCWSDYEYPEFYKFLHSLNRTNEIKLRPETDDYYKQVADDIKNIQMNHHASEGTIQKFKNYHRTSKKILGCIVKGEFQSSDYGEQFNTPIKEDLCEYPEK